MTTLSPSAVDCGPLNNPTNGQVMLPATTFNHVATYSCNSGYTLNGAQTRTCQASGMWSNAEPTCEGEQMQLGKIQSLKVQIAVQVSSPSNSACRFCTVCGCFIILWLTIQLVVTRSQSGHNILSCICTVT